MDIGTLNAQEAARLDAQVTAFNRALGQGEASSSELGRDEFLKILITQLQNQDPTAPMEDKAFIAQMAQFSTLEQMTNLSNEFQQISSVLNSSQAVSLLGKNVLLENGIEGVVAGVTNGAQPQVQVNEQWYDYKNITQILNK